MTWEERAATINPHDDFHDRRWNSEKLLAFWLLVFRFPALSLVGKTRPRQFIPARGRHFLSQPFGD